MGAPAKKRIQLTAEERHTIGEYAKQPLVPPSLERAIEDYISKKVGKRWDDPVILGRIRAAIRQLKNEYWRRREGREIRYTTGYRAIAYLTYLLPVYYAQFRWLMVHLAEEGLLNEDITVLDVGTGPGVVPLAICDFYEALGRGRARIFPVEREREQIEAFRSIVTTYTAHTDRIRIEPLLEADLMEVPPGDLPADVDLIVFSNVLNELTAADDGERSGILLRYAQHLSPDGTIAVIEPSDLDNSTMLRRVVRRAISRGDLSIYEPCAFPWGRYCSNERCWSFIRLPDIAPTKIMQALAAAPDAFRYINTDVKFSYALLRRDRRRRVAYTPGRKARFAPFSSLGRQVGRRINAIGALMSMDLGEGEYHTFLICDGTSSKPVFAVLPRYHVSCSNEVILRTGYGDLLSLRGVLVRYNQAEDAYNLLLQRTTEVERLEGGGSDERRRKEIGKESRRRNRE